MPIHTQAAFAVTLAMFGRMHCQNQMSQVWHLELNSRDPELPCWSSFELSVKSYVFNVLQFDECIPCLASEDYILYIPFCSIYLIMFPEDMSLYVINLWHEGYFDEWSWILQSQTIPEWCESEYSVLDSTIQRWKLFAELQRWLIWESHGWHQTKDPFDSLNRSSIPQSFAGDDIISSSKTLWAWPWQGSSHADNGHHRWNAW